MPTAGRVVLYAPDKDSPSVMSVAQPGAGDSGLRVFPATVIAHIGDGRCKLSVHGFSGIFTAPWGESTPGEPETGHWCYPQMTQRTVLVHEGRAARAKREG